jgi:hypothetical protein
MVSSSDQKTLYFASNRENQFYIIDTVSYKYKTVPYPSGGRGCMSIYTHPSNKFLYLGIQRGGLLNGTSYFGGNCFLAVYDLENNQYATTIYLAELINGRSDNATPACISFDKEKNRLYVGMFQSLRGICVIDVEKNNIESDIRFKTNEYNKYFQWVDPLSITTTDNHIISLNRNNCELAFIDKECMKLKNTIYLGSAPNGPRDLVVFQNEVIISYPERNGLIFINLSDYI